MIEQDYLMRMLLQFFQAMARSWELNRDNDDPQAAADMLEAAIGNATEMDGATLLSLSPDSIAQIMRVTDIDARVTQFVARSMLLESVYLTQAGRADLSKLRFEQAHAIAADYGFDLPDDPADFDSITAGLEAEAIAYINPASQAPSEMDDVLANMSDLVQIGQNSAKE